MKIEIKKPAEEEIKEAKSWPVWEKEVSEFPWEYGEDEVFLVVEGKATVTTEDGEKVTLCKGDYVKMPRGLKCTWNIEEAIKKHYNFG